MKSISTFMDFTDQVQRNCSPRLNVSWVGTPTSYSVLMQRRFRGQTVDYVQFDVIELFISFGLRAFEISASDWSTLIELSLFTNGLLQNILSVDIAFTIYPCFGVNDNSQAKPPTSRRFRDPFVLEYFEY